MIPGRPTSADVLVEDVWGDPVNSGSVRVLISRLRNLLAETDSPVVIRSTPGGYKVELNGAVIDRDQFSTIAAKAQHVLEPKLAIQLASDALELWNGQPFAEVGERPWAVTERERLLLVERSLRIRLANSHAALSDYGSALSEYEILRSSYPFDESITASTVQGLWHAGRRSEALNEIATMRSMMSSEVGLSLGAELTTLEQLLLNGDLPAPNSHSNTSTSPSGFGSNKRKLHLQVKTQFPPALSGVPFVPPHWFAQAERLFRRGAEFENAVHILSGPAGSGKSRATLELANAAEASGKVVLYGQWDREQCAPYAPLRRGLRLLAEGDEPSFFAGSEDILLSLSMSIESILSADPSANILWVLDDIHWADQDSLTVLRDLIRENSSSRLQFLVTTRTIRNRLPSVLERLIRDGFATHQEVGCLDSKQLRKLCKAVNSKLTNESIDELALSCRANTFLMLELSRAPSNNPTTLPANAKSLYRNSIDSLSSDARTLLFLAALMGAEVNADIMALATGNSAEKVTDLLASLLESGLLTEASPNFIAFDHDLARDLILNEISSTDRWQLHYQLGCALSTFKETSYSRPDFISSLDIARHFLLAGHMHTHLSVPHLMLAVDELLNAGAPKTALETAKQAEDLVAHRPTKERFLVLVCVAKSLAASGSLQAARFEFEDALSIAISLDDAEAQAIATIGMMGPWTRYWQPDPEVIGSLEALLTRDLTAATRALVGARLAIAKAPFETDLRDARRLSLAAVKGARSTHDQALLIDALYAHGRTLLGPGTELERLQLSREAFVLLQRVRVSASLECLTLQNYLIATVELGKVEETEEAMSQLHRLAASCEQPFAKWRDAVINTSYLTQDENQASAELALAESRAIGSRLELDAYRPTWFTQKVLLAVQFDDQSALQSLEPAFKNITNSDPMLGQALAGTVLSFGAADSCDKSRMLLKSLSTRLPTIDRDYSWLGTVALCIRLSQRLELASVTTALTKLLTPFRTQHIVLGTATGFLGPVEDFIT